MYYKVDKNNMENFVHSTQHRLCESPLVYIVHKTTHRLLRTTATTPGAEHHMQ